MQTQVKQENINQSSEEAMLAVQNSAPATQAKLAATKFDSQVQRISRQSSNFFAELPEKVSKFYQEYKLPILTFAALVATIITLRIALAILGAVNDIPLFRPFFELIGIGYTFWFTKRYLLKESTRKELGAFFESAKKQILG